MNAFYKKTKQTTTTHRTRIIGDKFEIEKTETITKDEGVMEKKEDYMFFRVSEEGKRGTIFALASTEDLHCIKEMIDKILEVK